MERNFQENRRNFHENIKKIQANWPSPEIRFVRRFSHSDEYISLHQRYIFFTFLYNLGVSLYHLDMISIYISKFKFCKLKRQKWKLKNLKTGSPSLFPPFSRYSDLATLSNRTTPLIRVIKVMRASPTPDPPHQGKFQGCFSNLMMQKQYPGTFAWNSGGSGMQRNTALRRVAEMAGSGNGG